MGLLQLLDRNHRITIITEKDKPVIIKEDGGLRRIINNIGDATSTTNNKLLSPVTAKTGGGIVRVDEITSIPVNHDGSGATKQVR